MRAKTWQKPTQSIRICQSWSSVERSTMGGLVPARLQALSIRRSHSEILVSDSSRTVVLLVARKMVSRAKMKMIQAKRMANSLQCFPQWSHLLPKTTNCISCLSYPLKNGRLPQASAAGTCLRAWVSNSRRWQSTASHLCEIQLSKKWGLIFRYRSKCQPRIKCSRSPISQSLLTHKKTWEAMQNRSHLRLESFNLAKAYKRVSIASKRHQQTRTWKIKIR